MEPKATFEIRSDKNGIFFILYLSGGQLEEPREIESSGNFDSIKDATDEAQRQCNFFVVNGWL